MSNRNFLYYFGTSTKSGLFDLGLDFKHNFPKLYSYTNPKLFRNNNFMDSFEFSKYNKSSFSFFYVLRFFQELKLHNINGIIFLTDQPHKILFLLIASLYKFKIIFYVHDPIPHYNETFLKKYFNIIFFKLAFILKSKLLTHPSYALRHSNYHALYLPRNEQISSSYLFSDITIDIIYYGRVDRYKNLDYIFRAAELNPQLKFLIISNGIIRPNNFCNNVLVINTFVDSPSLSKFINCSKFIILPYIHGTGTSHIANGLYLKKNIIISLNVVHFCTGIPSELLKYIHIVNLNDTFKIPTYVEFNGSDLSLINEFFSTKRFVRELI
jgi:hypothetical protein